MCNKWLFLIMIYFVSVLLLSCNSNYNSNASHKIKDVLSFKSRSLDPYILIGEIRKLGINYRMINDDGHGYQANRIIQTKYSNFEFIDNEDIVDVIYDMTRINVGNTITILIDKSSYKKYQEKLIALLGEDYRIGSDQWSEKAFIWSFSSKNTVDINTISVGVGRYDDSDYTIIYIESKN